MKKLNPKESARNREKAVLSHWRKNDTFKKSVEMRSGSEPFVFYEGPPTANGMPHIGHVLGRVMKDFVARYKTMTGHQVHRKAGWDTHGLPVELGVEKKLGISGKQEIENYGVEKFIQECKDSVFGYEKEWRELTEAIGYWVDLDNPYVTLEDNYIESVWHLLSQINKKGLLYKGHRVSPYCPSCETTLSSHEVAQGYKKVKDLSVTAKFTNDAGEHFLAWTTTPWTLPSHVALAVNRDLDYAKVLFERETYIVAEDLVSKVFQGEYQVLSTHSGADFVGMKYQPPFNFNIVSKGNIVVHTDFVTANSGTGIVHMAPAHGEDDYKAIRENGLDFVLLVDSKGCYTQEVTPLAGRFVKTCDVDIIKMLTQANKLFSKGKYEHEYPFCWRCKTPLLYYALESWLINMQAVKKQLVENNQQVEWFPSHVKDGRFGNFLNDVVDWNISRNRYWGTPLNVWECECGEQFVPSSKSELGEKAQRDISDVELHRPYVDNVKVTCSCGNVMTRVPYVVDVWFDSGSMPYAQHHYPFENKKTFETQFPADMIVEGIDQTRGWFYSLMAIGTLVYGVSPYKRVMALGHVLDENGKKMSKSEGNIIDPWDIINEFGTDSFRFALLSDSAPWNPKKFSKQIVQDAKSKVIDTLVNVYSFYDMYATIDGFNPNKFEKPSNVPLLDKWVLSRLNSVLSEASASLEAYDFVKPARAIAEFIDELSNWYVRRSRDRFWGSEMNDDKLSAYFTLHEVLLTLSKMLAPYTPFLSEELYLTLGGELESVHFEDYPPCDENLVNKDLEEQMAKVFVLVELGRNVRNENKLKNKQPLSMMYVVSQDAITSRELLDVVKDELNVKDLQYAEDASRFVVTNLKLNFKLVGKKLGKDLPKTKVFVENLDEKEIEKIFETGVLSFESHTLTRDELIVQNTPKEGYASASGENTTVVLDTNITSELKQEGYVREVIRAVQEYRKKLDLKVEERIELALGGNSELLNAVKQFENLLFENVLASKVSYEILDENVYEVEIEDKKLKLAIVR